MISVVNFLSIKEYDFPEQFFLFFAVDSKLFKESKEDTINLFGLELKRATGEVWKKALESNLGEQKMYNTAAGWIIKGGLRFLSWVVVAVSVYGPENLLNF